MERITYEKNPHASGYCNGGFGQPHGAGMSPVATAGAAGTAGTTADPGSGEIEGPGTSVDSNKPILSMGICRMTAGFPCRLPTEFKRKTT